MSDTDTVAANPCIQCRVTPAVKARLTAIAEQQHTTASALLQRVVDLVLMSPTDSAKEQEDRSVQPVGRGARLYVRLSSTDLRVIRERASGRRLAPATYAAVALSAHLRSAPPLPDRELTELRRAVAELGALGRNLNQIARAANSGGRNAGPSPQDLHAVVRVCGALKDHVKDLIQANTRSWERS